jgi:hypothetical protein
MFQPFAGQSTRHQFGGYFREDHFPMIADMVAMCVRNESGVTFVIWI